MAKKNEIQFWQGLEADRLAQTPAAGEPLWTTDTRNLYIGDGHTNGGILQGIDPTAIAEFDQYRSYPKDTLVVYSGNLYKANKDLGPSTWHLAGWDKVGTIINNTLTSTSITEALSAAQGKILEDKVATNKTAITANTAKTGITAAQTAAITANSTKTGITAVQATANKAALGGFSFVKITQVAYDALATKDSNTVYLIVG